MATKQVNARLKAESVDLIRRRLGPGEGVGSFLVRIYYFWEKEGCPVVDEMDEKNMELAALRAALADPAAVDAAIEMLKKRKGKKKL